MLNTPRITTALRRMHRTAASTGSVLRNRKTALVYLGTAAAVAAGAGSAGAAAASSPSTSLPAAYHASASPMRDAAAATDTSALITSLPSATGDSLSAPSLPSTAQAAAAAMSAGTRTPATVAHPAGSTPASIPAAGGGAVPVTAVPVTAPAPAPAAADLTAPAAAAVPAAQAQPTYPYTGNPQTDLVTVARYLVNDAGYSPAAAAGVAGCIQGESGASPEATQGYAAGGAGLIQWTPESSIAKYGATYGGNPQADFSSQLGGIARYNSANGDVAALNRISDPVAAADYYSQHFERPLVTDSDVRPAQAVAVYDALSGH